MIIKQKQKIHRSCINKKQTIGVISTSWFRNLLFYNSINDKFNTMHSRIHDYNLRNIRFQLREFIIFTNRIYSLNFIISTSWVSRFQPYEITILISWIHAFRFINELNLVSYFHFDNVSQVLHITLKLP
jgi:hypothetical protein